MLPSFGDDAMAQASYAIAATTPVTTTERDLLTVLNSLLDYCEWISIELAQAEAKLAAQQAAPDSA